MWHPGGAAVAAAARHRHVDGMARAAGRQRKTVAAPVVHPATDAPEAEVGFPSERIEEPAGSAGGVERESHRVHGEVAPLEVAA